MAIKISGSTIIDDSRNVVNAGIITATSFDGSGATLDSIPNGALDNSSVSYGGVSLSLGGSDATPAFDLTDATSYPYGSLTGISTDIVGDITPQLGGNLDGNSKDIYGVGIITATTFSGSASNMTGLTGASAATYGSSTLSPVITVNSDGKITGISTATISGESTTRTVNRYVATASQTLFPSTGSVTYTVGYIDVFINGTRLDSTEFTATNGTSITLTTGATVNDIVELIAFENVDLSGDDLGGARDTATLTTNSIASGITTTGTVTLSKTGVLISVHPVGISSGWLRLYTRSDLATADANRVRTVDPDPGSGVILETITSGISTVYFSPQTIFASAEDTPINTFNYRFTKDGGAGITTFTFKYVSLES